MRLSFFFVFAICLAAQTLPWRIIGPGGGGAMFQPAVSPHTTDDVLLRCDMTGAYMSTDGGSHWRMFNLRGVVRFFGFDPKDRDTIYAGTSGLYRSSDHGQTWKLIWPSAVDHIEMGSDHADETMVMPGGGTPKMLAFAVDPNQSERLFAAISEKNVVRLSESNDRGATWSEGDTLPDGAREIYVSKQGTIYAAGKQTISVRRDGKWTHHRGPTEWVDLSAGFDQESGQLVVYGITDSAIYVSRNAGEDWAKLEAFGPANFRAIATAANAPHTAYVSYRGYAPNYLGVAKTTDLGKTWELVWKERPNAASENIKDAWITERFGPDWGENPLDLGVAPNNPEIAYGTDLGRTMRTTDGGKTWQAVYSERVSKTSWKSTGLDVTNAYGLHFDPFDASRIFMTNTDIGLFRSEDGGKSWQSSTAGVPDKWVNTTYWMVFDPEVRGRAWAVASGTHDLPRPKMWRRGFSGIQGGVVVSEDGGVHWQGSSSGMPLTAATHLLLDPTSPRDARVLYVAGFGKGVYKSVDGGKSWALKNTGIEGSDPFAWRLARDGNGTLYLVIARRSEDGSIGNAFDGALYRSTDGAEHWTKMTLPLDVNGPNGIAIDPEDPNRLYLAAWRRKAWDADGGGGIYVSIDAGAMWTRALSEDQHIYDITIDERNPNRLYASGFESSAWQSDDKGRTWTRIPGFDFKWGQRVITDPRDPSQIYITTFGGGVWHGPAKGND